MGATVSIPQVGCGCGGSSTIEPRCGGTLPDSPDCANNYHFGMLLGVDDFRADQGFHLGHHRRHQRALHGYGVVYGYAVSFDPEGGQVRVEPGFVKALDHASCRGFGLAARGRACRQKQRQGDSREDRPHAGRSGGSHPAVRRPSRPWARRVRD